MKKIILLLACASVALTACNKNNPTPVPGGNLSCTMAIYGSGGAGVDNGVDVDYVNELIDAMKIGPTEKVNVISQYNFASNDASLPYVNGTAVMRLLKKNTDIEMIDDDIFEGKTCKTRADSNAVRIKAVNDKLKELVDEGAYSFEKLNGTNKVKMYLPSSISSFLDLAAQKYPADHYLFCVTGHGGSWGPQDDREISKAVAYDDNFIGADSQPIGITAKNLTAGINASTISGKIPVLYLNACSMNYLENLCEYAESPVKYALISFLVTNGTDNRKVMSELIKAEGNEASDLVNALMTAYESIYKEKSCDISLINLKNIKTAAAGIKDLVPLLKDDYLDDKSYYNSLIYNLYCSNGEKKGGCNKDFSQFLDELSKEANLDKNIKTLVNSILTNIKAAVEKTFYGKNCKIKQNLLTGAKFLGKTEYANSRKDYAASFDNNAFYKLTDWNTLFEVFDDDINDSEDEED